MPTDGPGIEQDSGRSADAWFSAGRFAVALALLITVCFPQVLSGLETFYFRDYGLFGYPLAAWFKDTIRHGEWPLWNPLNNCGLPFLAQWNTLTLYPLSLFYLLLPMPWSLSVFCLGHIFLAGMGGYFLARRWTGNNLAAAVGGIAFAWNGLTWHSLMWPNNIAALGWMPWVVLSAEKAWREGGRMIVVAGLVGAMQMLAGAPEVILFTWLIVGCLWLVDAFKRQQSILRLVLRGCGVGLLVAALAAAQLLPFLDLLAHSQRDNSFSGAEWGMPASGWANYLVPLFHCFSAGHDVYVQHDQYWTSSYYAGIGIAALALLAMWRARNARVLALAALMWICLLMAMGNNGFLYSGLRKLIPQLGFMRFPIKFVVPATFVIPFLAAYGVAWILELQKVELTRARKAIAAIGALVLGCIVVILVFGWRVQLAGDDPHLTLLSGLRSAAFLAAILGALIYLQRPMGFKRRILSRIVLLVLIWMDVFTHVPTLSPTIGPGVFDSNLIRSYWRQDDTNSPLLQAEAQVRPGDARVMKTQESRWKMYFGREDNPTNDVLGRRIALFADLNLLDQVPKLDGFYSLYLGRMDKVMKELYEGTNEAPGLKDFLGFLLENHPTNFMDWVERKTFMPTVTAGQKAIFLDDTNAFNALFQSNFDARSVVILPPEAQALVHATNRVEAKVTTEEFLDNRVTAAIDSAEPTVLVVAQSYYHPWRAYVDGNETKLWQANYAFQALEVPQGKHRVQLIYRDARFYAGGVISLAALLACAVLWWLGRRRVSTP